jgi:hypothetical protein
LPLRTKNPTQQSKNFANPGLRAVKALNQDFALEARQQIWMVHPDGESSDG